MHLVGVRNWLTAAALRSRIPPFYTRIARLAHLLLLPPSFPTLPSPRSPSRKLLVPCEFAVPSPIVRGGWRVPQFLRTRVAASARFLVELAELIRDAEPPRREIHLGPFDHRKTQYTLFVAIFRANLK